MEQFWKSNTHKIINYSIKQNYSNIPFKLYKTKKVFKFKIAEQYFRIA